jgi:ABC-type multidrug transport system fused ATPase/permease subunit
MAMGPRGMSRGYLTEEEKANRPKVTMALLKRIFSYLVPYWKQMVLVLAFIVLSSIMGLLPSVLTGRIIDSRTSILIAHRLSTILAADEILVIRDGMIAERGVHADLVKAGGTYAELYETQFYRPEEDSE